MKYGAGGLLLCRSNLTGIASKHVFTNPAANDPGFGAVYSPVAGHRAAQSIKNFFEEIFE
ncbi:hypothetical protein OAL10_09005 [Gammaproteobacteria bacterium]|nr:hypothetical protein [Gammaproteobacteria bacterium]